MFKNNHKIQIKVYFCLYGKLASSPITCYSFLSKTYVYYFAENS